MKKIDRLRRASLQPDSPNVSAQQAQMSEAAAMAAAMAEVDGENDGDEENGGQKEAVIAVAASAAKEEKLATQEPSPRPVPQRARNSQ